MQRGSTRFAALRGGLLVMTGALAACGGASQRPPTTETARVEPAGTTPSPSTHTGRAIVSRASRVLAQQESVTFGHGAAFTAPANWTISQDATTVSMTAPERDFRVTILERSGRSAVEVVAAAWHEVDPSFARETEHRSAPPAHDGWDEIVQTVYRTPPSESRAVLSIAFRRSERVYIMLVDAAVSAIDRRGGQLQTAIETLRAEGVGEESWAGRTAHPLEAERAAAFEHFIRTAMADEAIPGVAVGVVQHGRLVYSRGFGVRALGTHEPVTPHTLFMIGSNTKSLTTLLMARGVDAGRFRWDTPLTQLLPTFRLADAATTQRIDLQHSVCACTGMPRRDLEFLFEYDHATPEHWVETLATMTPTTGFGEVFQYSNLLVAAGGFAAARASNPHGDLRTATARAMRTEVFEPLGMRDSTLEIREAQRREYAEPHGWTLRHEITLLPLSVERGIESLGPAGAAWSTVEDVSRYLAMELRNGVLPDGRRFVSEAALLERRNPRVRVGEHAQYGLGLETSDAHGIVSVSHGGNTQGFSSDMVFLPSLDMGLVVLTNAASANGFVHAVERRLMEIVLDAREEAADRLAFERDDRLHALAELSARLDAPAPRDWYAPWLGTYRSADLGSLTFSERDGSLWLDAGEWQSRVGRERAASGETSLVLLDPPLEGIELRPPSSASEATLVLDYPQNPYRFARETTTAVGRR